MVIENNHGLLFPWEGPGKMLGQLSLFGLYRLSIGLLCTLPSK